MEQFDYNKYRKNNLLLKEDTPPKLGTPPPSQVSKVGAKTSKFVADNKTFIEKMKAVVGSDIKVLASIMKTIMNTVVTDKKIPLSSDAKKVIDFLNSVAAQNTSPSNVKENFNEATMKEFTYDQQAEEDAESFVSTPRGNSFVISLKSFISRPYEDDELQDFLNDLGLTREQFLAVAQAAGMKLQSGWGGITIKDRNYKGTTPYIEYIPDTGKWWVG
jgi:hypothetical protein